MYVCVFVSVYAFVCHYVCMIVCLCICISLCVYVSKILLWSGKISGVVSSREKHVIYAHILLMNC